MLDPEGLQTIVNTVATTLLRNYDQIKAATAVSGDLGLTMDADHSAAGAVLLQFISFIEGGAIAADADRRKKLNKVRSGFL